MNKHDETRMSPARNRRGVTARIGTLGLAAALGVGLLGAPTPAEASPRVGFSVRVGHSPHYNRYRHHRNVRVPQRLHYGQPAYRPYFSGRFWFGAHRHFHMVYRFPYRSSSRWGFSVAQYCEGGLYDTDYDYRGKYKYRYDKKRSYRDDRYYEDEYDRYDEEDEYDEDEEDDRHRRRRRR